MAVPSLSLAGLPKKSSRGDAILAYLHLGEITRLASASKRTRDAVTQADGSLRCQNMFVTFDCEAVVDSHSHGLPVATPRSDLGAALSRVRIPQLRSLLVKVTTKECKDYAINAKLCPINRVCTCPAGDA